METTTVVLFFIGLALLIFGAELLVRGASAMATLAGVSPLVIGLTVVAFGTSAPELAINIQSIMQVQSNIAVGNVVGSNIFNVLFILGLSALIIPLSVKQQLIRLDVPLMIGASVVVLLMALDHYIDRLEGLILFIGIVSYTIYLIKKSRRETLDHHTQNKKEGHEPSKKTFWFIIRDLIFILIGLALLVLGSGWLVDGAVGFARYLGVSDLIIGLTIIAAGTSLPEVATSIVAAVRGERDIAVGNVVGSNLFNLLAVLGLTGIVAPQGIYVDPSAVSFDIPLMTAVAFACLPVFFTDLVISRWEGAVFLGYYVTYTVYLYLASTQHALLNTFSMIMVEFIVPITVITLAVLSYRYWRLTRKKLNKNSGAHA